MEILLTEAWDLTVDAHGNIATVNGGYGIAQNVANEIKLERGEGWYDQSQGTPYFVTILGINPNWSLIRNTLIDRAEHVDGVTRADMDLYLDVQRNLHGNIYLLTDIREEEPYNVVF